MRDDLAVARRLLRHQVDLPIRTHGARWDLPSVVTRLLGGLVILAIRKNAQVVHALARTDPIHSVDNVRATVALLQLEALD